MKKAGILLLFVLTKAFCGEGFFKKEQLDNQELFKKIEPASLLVEEFQADSQSWRHVGNAFFISPKGHLLTNYHVAATCLYSNKAYFRKIYKSPSEISIKGFQSMDQGGVDCPGLRVTSSLDGIKKKSIRLLFLPRVPQESQDGLTPQQSEGPFHDFAILKLSEEQNLAEGSWFSIKQLDEKEFSEGTRVFQVGYPAETRRLENSDKVKNHDYDEVATGDYRIATGEILPVLPEYFYQPQKTHYIYTQTDGAMGSSGSALINSKGDLLGLILGSGSIENSTKLGTCVPRFEYCAGVSLYVKVNKILEILKKELTLEF